MKNNNSGFSLTELMTVIVVIAILSSYPVYTYLSSHKKAIRDEAIFRLLSLQSDLERQYAIAGSYISNYTVPNTEHYSYKVTNSNANQAYTITATALPTLTSDPSRPNSQLSDKEQNTDCSVLTINNASTKTPNICWTRD